MKTFFRRLRIWLVRDDLFVRIAFLLTGLPLGGLGIAMCVSIAGPEVAAACTAACGCSRHLGPSILVIGWMFAILLTAYGALLVSRCALSAQSRTARFAEKFFPDLSAVEAIIIVIVIIVSVGLSAALLTLFLRLLGVRGQRGAWSLVRRKAASSTTGLIPVHGPKAVIGNHRERTVAPLHRYSGRVP